MDINNGFVQAQQKKPFESLEFTDKDKEQFEAERKQAEAKNRAEQKEYFRYKRDVFDYDEAPDYMRSQYAQVDEVKKEYKNIADVLDNGQIRLRDKDRAELEVKQGRNMSHIMVNSKKFGGDSEKMVAIKNNLLRLEQALSAEHAFEKKVTDEEIGALEQLYDNVIASCQDYLINKTTRTRTDRYKMVINRMNQLMEEKGLISSMREKLNVPNRKNYFINISRMSDLLISARVYELGREPRALTNMVKTQKEAIGASKEITESFKAFDNTVLGGLDEPTKMVYTLLSLQNSVNNYVKKAGDDNQNLCMYLLNMLKGFPDGGHVEYFNVGQAGYKGDGFLRSYKKGKRGSAKAATCIGIRQTEEGKLYVRTSGDWVELPYNRHVVIDHMSMSFLNNEELVGSEAVNSVFSWLDNMDTDEINQVELRNICMKIISNRTGIKRNDFDNLSTIQIKRVAVFAMKNWVDRANIEEYLNKINAKHKYSQKMINIAEVKEVLDFRDKNKEKIDKKVKFLEPEEKQIEEEKKEQKKQADPEWTEEEESVKNLLADILYSRDTWTADATVNESHKRMKKVLEDNAYALLLLIKDADMAKKMLSKLPVPDEMVKKWTEVFDTKRKQYIDDGMQTKLTIAAFAGKLNKSAAANLMRVGINSIEQEELVNILVDIEEKLNEGIDAGAQLFQEQLAGHVDTLLKAPELEEVEANGLNPLMDRRGLNAEQREKVIKLGETQLNNKIKESMFGNEGQGKFFRNIMKNYFAEVSTMDKRSMIAAMIRDAKPSSVKVSKDMTDEQMNALAGRYIGGMFKGAGPLFQKVLQGIPQGCIPEELRPAFDDVKSNLLPIPQEIVEAQLLSMVERSNGSITKIEVVKPLGAASVGQAFACKIYGPSISSKGEEVVIKLLRPDVRNRMEREKVIMKKYAADTNEGMAKTYEGQLKRIEEEMDLTIEATNVEKGQIYDKLREYRAGEDKVRAMKLNKMIAPTTNSMVIEKADGTTVDKYLTSVKEQLEKVLAPYLIKNEKGKTVYEDGLPKVDLTKCTMEDSLKIRKVVTELVDGSIKRQNHLIKVTEKWVEEGLFGAGFYHGDLHAGNIMVSEAGATIIDFGNATQLDSRQKEIVTKMMTAAAISDVKLFRHGFHLLMNNDENAEAHYQRVRPQFTAMLNEILKLGSGKQAGQRIWTALLKAQELGLELPAAIFNFSQCQIRLQNTVSDMNDQITGMQDLIGKLDDLETRNDIDIDAYEALKELILRRPSMIERAICATKDSLLVESNDDFDKEMTDELKLTDAESRKEFDRVYMIEQLPKKEYDELAEMLHDAIYGDDGKMFNVNTRVASAALLKTNSLFKKVAKENGKEWVNTLLDMLTVDKPDLEAMLDMIPIYGKLRKYRRAQDDNNPQEIVDKYREDFVSEYKKARAKALEGKTDTGGAVDPEPEMVVRNILNPSFYYNISKEEVNEEIKRYYDYPVLGDKLKEKWEALVDFKFDENHTEEERSYEKALELIKDLSKAYRRVLWHKVDELEKSLKEYKYKKCNKNKPEGFLEAMGYVLQDNIKKATKRLGYWWSFWHRKKIRNMDQ